jgi:hypothetical protein
MSDNKALKVYEDLPNWARGVVVVGGLVVLYIVGNTIYKKIQGLSNNVDTQNKLNQVNNDLNDKINQGQQPTFNSTQYNNFADSIAAAFSGCDFSSPIIPISTKIPVIGGYSNSGAVVYNIISQFNNDVDFLALQKAFGNRTISKSWVCGGDYTNVDLEAAVTNQLNNSEIAGINDLLSKRNITLRF